MKNWLYDDERLSCYNRGRRGDSKTFLEPLKGYQVSQEDQLQSTGCVIVKK